MSKTAFAEKRAVVTGGAQGIGRAIAERLRDGGAQVCLWDMDADLGLEVADQMGAGVVARAVDVTDYKAVADAATETSKQFGGIDILVNNAGISGPNVPTWEYPVEDWRQVLDIDLNGVFYCCRSVVPIMHSGKYGRIVNIA